MLNVIKCYSFLIFKDRDMKRITLACFLLLASMAVFADDCIGDADYQVCTKSQKQSNGDETISSYDTEGNNYSITSGSRENSDGSTEVFSSDSEGNQYSIKSWCDSKGCHSTDSDGNTCTITNLGETIGC